MLSFELFPESFVRARLEDKTPVTFIIAVLTWLIGLRTELPVGQLLTLAKNFELAAEFDKIFVAIHILGRKMRL